MIPVLRPLLIAAAAATLVVASDASSLAGEHVQRLAPSVDYFGLGDSYSAGPLIAPSRTDPTGCFRSSNNYPAFLAGYLDVTTYRDVSCSGARVRDFAKRQTPAL